MVLLLGACLYITDDMQQARLGGSASAGPGDADADADADADDSGRSAPFPAVDALSPTFGTTAGGQVVTISGTNLDGVTSVRFGGAEGELLVATSSGLRVTTPLAAADGEVEVVVWTGSTTTGAGSFEYIADGAGLVGLLGWVGVT